MPRRRPTLKAISGFDEHSPASWVLASSSSAKDCLLTAGCLEPNTWQPMDLGIRSRVALVTAASRGIGRACALSLAAEGCRLAVSSRRAESLEPLISELLESGAEDAIGLEIDLREQSQLEQGLELVRARLGEVEILVANGPGPPSGQVEAIALPDWQRALDVSLLAMVGLTREVLPGMRRSGWGRIVFVTTVGVLMGQPNMVLSNATRLAVVGLAKTLSLELGPVDILINVVAPGPIEGDRMRELIDQMARREGISREAARAIWLDEVPLGRMGRPEDVSSMVALLCSTACRYVTGAVIPVDGGKSRGY